MNNQPLVTVYITNYNYGRYLDQSISSVLHQTFPSIELLIIDDGSTDNSVEVIERFAAHPSIKVIYQRNKGLNTTNNIAMRAAAGKYIVRLDADDFFEPEAVERMVAVLEADEDLGLVFPDYYYVDEEGKRTGEERRHNFENEVSLFDQPAHGACTMIRLSYLKELGGYNESFDCQDGYDLWVKFVTKYRVTNVNTPLFSYRRHHANSTLNEERILNARKQIKESFVRQHLNPPRAAAIIPLRTFWVGKENLPLAKLDRTTFLERKVEMCLAAKRIDQVVISAAEDSLLTFARNIYDNHPRVTVVSRPKAFANPNESLFSTVKHAVDILGEKGIRPEAVMSVSVDFPFVSPDVMDDAVNTLVLFNSDGVLSVRPDNHMYYQHNGHTLKPILGGDKFTRLEREALYKGAGGVILCKVSSLLESGSLLSGRVSHVVVDQLNALGVTTELDLRLIRILAKEEIVTTPRV